MIVPRLESLPQELIDQIASDIVVRSDGVRDPFVPDKLADLSHLSRTCKRLYETCAPTLFRRVIFQRGDERALYFLQSLISKPSLRKHVRIFKAMGGWSQGGNAIDKLAEEVVASDPVARLILQESYFELWELVTVLSWKLLPDLVALSTTTQVMHLVTWWPEKQRLQGSSISALQLVHIEYTHRDNYCEDMFGWKQAFQPCSIPAALHTIHLKHQHSTAPKLRDNHIHRELDNESLHLAASLRRLDLQSCLPTLGDERDCVARLIGTLDKCTSLTHLVFVDECAFLKGMLEVVSKSKVLTFNLKTLEIQMEWVQERLDKHTLSRLSSFIHVTSLTLPWIKLEGDTFLGSTVWPPSLESLTLSVTAVVVFHVTSLQTMIKARHFPTSMQDITFRWYMHEYDLKHVERIVSLFDLLRAWHKEFASSGIALLHEHPDPYDLHDSSPRFTCTSLEQE